MLTAAAIIQPTGPWGSQGDAAAWTLHCPVCGAAQVEWWSPTRRPARRRARARGQGQGCVGDHAAATVQPGRDDCELGSPMGTLGGYVTIELFCPSGHGFDLVIANHKGGQQVGVVLAGDRSWG